MTLVEVKIDNSVTKQSGPYCFKIQGELHHLTGALLPYGDQTPMYAQIYILDTAEQLNVRRANNNNLDPVRGPLICDSGARSSPPERSCS